MQEYLTQTIRDFFKLRPIIGEKEYTIQISAYLQIFIPRDKNSEFNIIPLQMYQSATELARDICKVLEKTFDKPEQNRKETV
nr:MAG TPA: hypothetical protein [Caudoviricetes sp.]